MSKLNKPGWMLEFHAEHGIWPIAGGSDGGGVTVTDGTPAPAPAPAQETGPATPAPTNSVDPNAFNRGAGEAPGQAPNPPAGGDGQGRTFTAQEVEEFRRQERDKLYPKIESIEAELRREREEREAEKAARAEEEARAEEATRKEGENELDVRELLTKKEQEWTERFNQIQAEQQQSQALLEKERQFNALQEFTRNQLGVHEDDIMPQLRDTVGGNTEEEIQASVQRAIQKTNDILASVSEAQQVQRQATPTTRVTQPGVGGPLESSEQLTRTYSPQDIANMSMKEYAANRDQFLGAAGRQGPYGGGGR